MYRHFFKRVIDIILSLGGIIFFALPMLIIVIAIKADSKGPAIFKTHRVGKNCKPFKFYKFRSMRIDAPEDCAPRLLETDYVTKVGKFLRRTSLDEIPQLFCIFVGNMSVVGPRPAGLSEQDLIDAREQYGANGVLPGLTGLAQITGRDVLASHPEEKARIDGEYCKKITFLRDTKIFFKTFKKVLKREDVVEGEAALQAEMEHPEDLEKVEREAATELAAAETRAKEGFAELLRNPSPQSENLLVG
ncbi:MAG: sugar transferase [Clostridia bacterium]|nr:sugar transferase [Clostridia bacterium]